MPSISLAKGKGSISHNNREYSTDNVDITKTKNNITYKKETIFEAYTNCFSFAVEEYNKTQNRSDRRIDGVPGYMEQIKNSKNGEKLFYENIVQVGNMFDSHIDSSQGDICKKILDDYMLSFEERNPNLYVFNAVLHLDEQTPHLHIDYIPVAHNYKNGLNVRNSLDRAFKEQGVYGESNKYENRTIAWQNSEKDYIEKIMLNYDLERTEDKGLKREHLTVEQYKAVVNHIDNEVDKIPNYIKATPTLLNKEKVTVNINDLEQLEERAKLSYIYEDTSKKLISELKNSKVNSLHQEIKNVKDEFTGAKERYNDLVEKHNSIVIDRNKLLEFSKQSIEENKKLNNDILKLNETIDLLKEQKEDVTHRFVNVTKAVGMLKYDKNGKYGIDNLTDEQSRLFDAIKNYTKEHLQATDEKELLKEITEKVGFSKGIENQIKALEPKVIIKSREIGR